MTWRRIGPVLAVLATCAWAWAGPVRAEKIRIEKADDLPPHTYTIDAKAVDFLDDDAKLAKLAAAVNADLLADLETYEIPDKTTLQEYYGMLGRIALLEKRWDDYRAWREKVIALEDKEPDRLTNGLFTLSWIEAVEAGAPDLPAAIAANMSARLEPLPYEIVADDLQSMKGNAEIVSRTLLEGVLESRIQPVLDQSDGEISDDIARTLVANGIMVRTYLPYAPVVAQTLATYLAAHAVEKPDIWAEREVELDPAADARPVLLAVWDSGVDVDLFPGQVWTNPDEVPGNGKDDDANGYVDDVHGIAYTLHADKTPDLLFPIGKLPMGRDEMQMLNKGMSDLNSNIDSDEATALKQALGGLAKEDVRPFLESLTAYGGYSHGTHVAGISTAGNPFVRVLVARMTYPHEMIPEKPTIEQARKDSTMFRETVAYFQDAGVRVVNMSWGGDVASIESDLEAHDRGGDPEARKKLARRIYEIGKAGLETAIEQAPEILFVTSAGNSNSDKEFDEFYPSSMVADNLMSVGAVDQAGDETGFTSFGRVDVYGNGFEVESWMPGGARQKLSGTSMSSPQVANLAAKILALRPELTPVQVREIIVSTADVRETGEREYRLLNPKAALAKVQGES